MKILSPAGNLESLTQAVSCGCDEVYLGVNEFNARNNVDGFTLDNLEKAVDFCHLFNVKVNLAINILFSFEELESAFNVCQKAFNMGVDHFIVQDLGLASLINKYLPKAVLHASTQMGIHNLEGVNAILPYGFKRVVLARETPLEEIKRIKQNCQIEIEYFVHGALCVSFSGNCYLSSYLNDASGNRGRCKQLCRLPFSLHFENQKLKSGYLLSAKDFDMSKKLDLLQDAGVDVLKIEGRARRPFYVGSITRYYVQLLDKKPADKNLVSLAFNRGFTCGYFDGNGNIISDYQAHVGINVGKITKVNYGKNFNQVYFTSTRALHPKSTFKIFNGKKETAVVSAYDLKELENDTYMFTTTTRLNPLDSVNLIQDSFLVSQMASLKPKRHIKITIFAKVNEKIKAEFSLGDKTYTIFGQTLSKAKSLPLEKNEVIENFSKSPYFNCELSFGEFEQVFLIKSQLNAFRREVFDGVFNALTLAYKNQSNVKIDLMKELSSTGEIATCLNDFLLVQEYSNLHTLSQRNVIYSPKSYSVKDVKTFQTECQKYNKLAILDLPNFAYKDDIALLKSIIERTGVTFVANNYYALSIKGNKIIGAGLNVFNPITAKLLNAPYLTAEMPCASKINFPYMTLRHCPYKNHLNANCFNCPHKEGYYFKMQSGKKLFINRKKLSSCTFYLTE